MIGGWAYNRYAEPRFTGDIDFFVSNSSQNEKKIRKILGAFGFDKLLPPVEVSLFLKKVVMLGRPPNRIDLITDIDGISFEEAWKNKVFGELDEIPVYFIALRDLILNKEAAGRDKDRADAKVLRKMLEATQSA